MSDFDVFVEAMCDVADPEAARHIRDGARHNPIVKAAINQAMLAAFDTRQALQWLAAVMIHHNQKLTTELASVAQNHPPKSIIINGVRYEPKTVLIPWDGKP
jgi:hypothetical protein